MEAPCTCICLFPGSHEEPPSWEQDPFCPKHPVEFILLARIEELEVAFREAISDMEDIIAYMPAYFREKWSYDKGISDAKEVLGQP